jgi:hypothetical protein
MFITKRKSKLSSSIHQLAQKVEALNLLVVKKEVQLEIPSTSNFDQKEHIHRLVYQLSCNFALDRYLDIFAF